MPQCLMGREWRELNHNTLAFSELKSINPTHLLSDVIFNCSTLLLASKLIPHVVSAFTLQAWYHCWPTVLEIYYFKYYRQQHYTFCNHCSNTFFQVRSKWIQRIQKHIRPLCKPQRKCLSFYSSVLFIILLFPSHSKYKLGRWKL